MQYQYQVTVTAGQATTPKFTFKAGAPAAVVDWGDGTPQTAVTSGVELNHTYTNAGTYTVTLIAPQQAIYLTQVDISADRVTGSLWAANFGRFAALQQYAANNNNGMTGGFGLASLPSGMTYLKLVNTHSTITGGTTPCLAKSIDLYLTSMTMTQAQVDDVIGRLFADRTTFTTRNNRLEIGGTNPDPSGVYQAANPPTTGLEKVYTLVNDNLGEGFKKWTIVY